MVPGAGLEPARHRCRRILSPLRLPISPSGQALQSYKIFNHRANKTGNSKQAQVVRKEGFYPAKRTGSPAFSWLILMYGQKGKQFI